MVSELDPVEEAEDQSAVPEATILDVATGGARNEPEEMVLILDPREPEEARPSEGGLPQEEDADETKEDVAVVDTGAEEPEVWSTRSGEVLVHAKADVDVGDIPTEAAETRLALLRALGLDEQTPHEEVINKVNSIMGTSSHDVPVDHLIQDDDHAGPTPQIQDAVEALVAAVEPGDESIADLLEMVLLKVEEDTDLLTLREMLTSTHASPSKEPQEKQAIVVPRVQVMQHVLSVGDTGCTPAKLNRADTDPSSPEISMTEILLFKDPDIGWMWSIDPEAHENDSFHNNAIDVDYPVQVILKMVDGDVYYAQNHKSQQIMSGKTIMVERPGKIVIDVRKTSNCLKPDRHKHTFIIRAKTKRKDGARSPGASACY